MKALYSLRRKKRVLWRKIGVGRGESSFLGGFWTFARDFLSRGGGGELKSGFSFVLWQSGFQASRYAGPAVKLPPALPCLAVTGLL